MLEKILDNMRQLGRTVQSKGDELDYFELARLLCDFSDANVYIFSSDAKILGYSWVEGYSSKKLGEFMKARVMPVEFTKKLDDTQESTICDEDACLFDDVEDMKKTKCAKHLMYVPIHGAGHERLGTVMLVRVANSFTVEDMLLAEYLATLLGIEILHDRGRNIEETSRSRVAVQMAMRALSYSEAKAMKRIIMELSELEGGLEGVVIASKIADKDDVKVTRSVIVSALRKLESAGLISSRSLGMKGTLISILNPLFAEELAKTGFNSKL